MKQSALALAGFLTLLAPAAAQAAQAGDILRDHLYAGTLRAGLDALQPMAEGGDAEARFGVGLLTFATGVERLAQGLYRHGLAAPETGMMGPMLGVPIPVNPKPEPLTYDGMRALLETLVQDLDASRGLLVAAGEAGGDYVVKLDPLKFRLDVNGDGEVAEAESVAGLLSQQFGVDFTQPPQAPGEEDGTSASPVAAPEFGFDRADAIWLAGYSQVVAAQVDFVLAHDFSDFFNAVFHRFFPKAGLPMQDFAQGGAVFMDPSSDSAIMDAVAAIHTLNWPVADKARLAGVRARLQEITALSRENWKAILAETDDDAEVVPSPRQTAAVPDAAVTDDMVAAWHETLDAADKILAGELLVPHWRFRQGFDLKAYFDTAERTDLVMVLSGYGALPFLKDGPVADAETFAAANRVFGDNLLGYAFWFN